MKKLICFVYLLIVSLHADLLAAERLNFLLITVDDMSQDSVGVFGCKVDNITPHIDKLAGESMRFVQAHVTAAICQPCRASWMTGRYPHNSGALGFNAINAGVPTLPETLRSAGYLTGILGKLAHVVHERPMAWEVSSEAGKNPKTYYDNAVAFFAKAKAENKPFFYMSNCHDPHRPFAGSEQGRQKAAKQANKADKGKKAGKNKRTASGGDEETFTGKNAEPSRVYKPEEVYVPGFLPDIADVRKEIAQYYTSVHRADDTVGEVLRALKEAGLENNTVVFFLSDHGMPLPFSKTNVYFHSNRTPWIIRWPGVTKPGVVDDQHMINGIDLAPTALDILGLSNLQGADGKSFVPVLKGGKQEGRDFVFNHINTISSGKSYPMRAIKDRQFGYLFNQWSDGKTYFRNESMAGLTFKAMDQAAKTDKAIAARVELFVQRVPEEFYDFASDPDAKNNLIADPKYQDKIAEFRQTMLREMKKSNDPQTGNFEQWLQQHK